MKYRLSLSAILLLFTAALGAQPPAPAAPVPAALLSAQKIFLSNGGSPMEGSLSGWPNRAYNDFYLALKSEGKFALVDDPSLADLVLTVQPSDQLEFKLTIVDRKSQFLLWTLFQPVQICTLQKTCDKNFDTAMASLVKQFDQLTAKSTATQ